MTQLLHGDTPTFQNALTPLMWMLTLTYVDTHGSYYNASLARHYTALLASTGWVPSRLRVDPEAGLHALLFVHNATGRGVVAFRTSHTEHTRLHAAQRHTHMHVHAIAFMQVRTRLYATADVLHKLVL